MADGAVADGTDRTSLIGRWCYVRAKTMRHRWAVRIIDVQPSGFVKVSANSEGYPDVKRAFGNPRWCKLDEVMWT